MNFKQRLLHNLGFSPTDEQAAAIDALTAYLSGKIPERVFMLKGYAGTGKTSLISALVKSLDHVGITCVLMAPTGRAAKVLSSYAIHPASTIHRQIYTPRKSKDGGLRFVLAHNKETRAVFIVDEISMIGDGGSVLGGSWGETQSLLEDLLNYVMTGRNKLILLGDQAQLPPVGFSKSPLFEKRYLEKTFGVREHVIELTEVVRQASDSLILSDATMLRQHMFGTQDLPQLKLGDDVVGVEGMELQDLLESAISEFGEDQVLIITRSNKRANQYNGQIRVRIKWFEEEIASGERMMIVKNNYFWLKDDKDAGFLANGDFVEVLEVRNKEELYGNRFADVTIRLPDDPATKTYDVKIWLESIAIDQANIPYAQVQKLFEAIEEDYMDIAGRKKRYAKVMENPYYQALQVKFAYAVTCHKSQGGQWDAVFIDPEVFQEEMLLEPDFLKWLYTAFTRAVQRVYLINFPKQLLP